MDLSSASSDLGQAGLSTRVRALIGAAIVLGGALILMLPSLYNGMPFVLWDTPSYLSVAKLVLAADPTAVIVTLENDPALIATPPTQAERQELLAAAASHLGARRVGYSLFLERGLEWISFWGVAFLQCLAVSAALYLALSAIWGAELRAWKFLALCAGVALLTSGGIVASLMMPDIFGSVLLLLLAWLFTVLPNRTSAISAAVFLALVLILSIHRAHAPLSIAVMIAGVIVVWLRGIPLRGVVKPVALLFGAMVGGAVLNAGLNAFAERAMGMPFEQPPFLMARAIDDGAGRRYLETSCDPAGFEICKFKDRLLKQYFWPGNTALFHNDVAEGGLYMIESLEVRKRLREQQAAFAREAILAYPLDQLRGSAKNILKLLLTARMNGPLSDPSFSYQGYAGHRGWLGNSVLLDAVPGVEVCKQIPQAFCGNVDFKIVSWLFYGGYLLGAAALAWIALGFIARHRLSFSRLDRVDTFILLILIGVVMNAVVMGILGGEYSRLQTRVNWLWPALAMAVALLSPEKILSPRAMLASWRARQASR